MGQYYLGIDQSTQGTKAVLFDEAGHLVCRCDRAHRQLVSKRGWVSHDLEEIWAATCGAVSDVIGKAGISAGEIAGVGISNQRETSAAFDRVTGRPFCDAVVWQCSRAEPVCRALEQHNPGLAELVRQRTGLNLSPYFPAAKFAWILQNIPEAEAAQREGRLALGTIDSWLVYKLTGGNAFRTDYSNASRTQLFDIVRLRWDEELCHLFGVEPASLPEVTDSDACFGETDFDGLLPRKVPIHGVLGDSHAALFGQGCFAPGQTKSTYGTGSSVMMNTGEVPVFSDRGIVTSLAWKVGGRVNYVLEGNINYSGAVVTWLKDDLHLIGSAGETGALAEAANPADTTYLVPAFSGLGAPYWKPDARAMLCGMTRLTGRNEIVRAALDSIAYQIGDIVAAMNAGSAEKEADAETAAGESAGHQTGAVRRGSTENGTGETGKDAAQPGLRAIHVTELRVDGGPTKNSYLMQKQSNTLQLPVLVPEAEELSAIGAAACAGIAQGFWKKDDVFGGRRSRTYAPNISAAEAARLAEGWHAALRSAAGTADGRNV